MATGVNVKMGVSGVQQFKQGMKESQAAVKTLDQALKLNEQQLKSTGDAELYLQNKTKILEDQIAKQTQVVKQSQAALDAMRRNGVQETSTAFQQMQANVYKASTDLMRMRTELDGVGDSGADAATEADTLTESLQNVGKGISWQNVTSGIEKITGSLEKAAKKALEVGKAITREVLGAGSWADDLHTRARYYGLSDEELQRMEKTSGLVDTSVDTIVGAQKKLRKGIGSADTGVMGAFAALIGEGYDPKAEGWENAFWDAGEALMNFTDAEEKEVYAQKLFGRSWNELIPLFETGREKYDELNASWSVVSDENLKKLQEMDDQYQKLSAEFETLKMTLMATLSETLTPLMETLTGLMAKFNEYLATPEGKEMMEKLGEAIKNMFTDLTNADPEKIIENLSGIFDKIQGGLQWLIDNKDTVVNALKIIVGGFALLKLGSLAANIGQIVNGLKGLGGGAATGAASNAGGIGNAISGGATSTAAATGGGWLAKAGGALKSIGSVGVFAAPFALFGDALTHDIQLMNQWEENGRKYLEERERKIGDYSGSDMFGMWQTMTDYTNISGNSQSEDAAAMVNMAKQWNDWVWNDAENKQFDRLADLMTQEEFEAFNDSMDDILNGRAHYSQEEMDNFYAPMHRALELIEGEMKTQNEKNNVTSEDIQALNALPENVKSAVREGMNGITIIINEGAVDLIGNRAGGRLGQKVIDLVQ